MTNRLLSLYQSNLPDLGDFACDTSGSPHDGVDISQPGTLNMEEINMTARLLWEVAEDVTKIV